MRSVSLWAGSAAAVLVALASGCTEKKSDTATGQSAEGGGGTGVALVTGLASDLRLSADGSQAAFLLDARKPRVEGLAPQIVIGELQLATTDGGKPRKVGEGVVNAPGGYLFSPDAKWLLFLQAYNAAEHEGELKVVSTASADPARSLAKGVTYFIVSPDSKWVAFVESGTLRVAPLGSEAVVPTDVSPEVNNAEFAPDSSFLLVKRSLAAKGALQLARTGQWAKLLPLGEQVGDYLVSSDARYVAFSQRSATLPGTYDLFHAATADAKAKKIADGVTTGAPFSGESFGFSPDARYLARIEGGRPEKRGNLVVGLADGTPGKQVAENVYHFQFAPDSTAVAYLDRFADNKGRESGHGFMGIAVAPEWKPKPIGERVPNFEWGADGKAIAFISRFFKPIYSVDLMLYRVGEEAAKKVQEGVFGYEFSAQNKYLFARSKCIRDGRACELYALELGAPDATMKKVMEGVYSFKVAPKDPERVLATYARIDTPNYDAMAVNVKTGQFKTLERDIALPALFASPDGSSVAYVVAQKQRAGVYVSKAAP